MIKKKSDCDPVIRHLCCEWAKERRIPSKPEFQPSFGDFSAWLSQKGYSHYLNFRSTMGPLYDAEMWFDQEFGQTWRN